MISRHSASTFGLAGGLIVIILGGLLALQGELSTLVIVGATFLPLVVTIIVAALAGKQAREKGQNVTVEGAVVGLFITAGVLVSNLIVSRSPAYEKAISTLATSEGSLQITPFELSAESLLGSLLLNVLIATVIANLGARLFVNRRHVNVYPQPD